MEELHRSGVDLGRFRLYGWWDGPFWGLLGDISGYAAATARLLAVLVVLITLSNLGYGFISVAHAGPPPQGAPGQCAQQLRSAASRIPASRAFLPSKYPYPPLVPGCVAFGMGSKPLLLLSSGGLLQTGEVLRRGNRPLWEQQVALLQGSNQLPRVPNHQPLAGEGPGGSGYLIKVLQNKRYPRGEFGDSLVITYHFGGQGSPRELIPAQQQFVAGVHAGDGSADPKRSSISVTGGAHDLPLLMAVLSQVPGAHLYPLESAEEGFRLKIFSQEGLMFYLETLHAGGFNHSTKWKPLQEISQRLEMGLDFHQIISRPTSPTMFYYGGLFGSDGYLNGGGGVRSCRLEVSAKHEPDLLGLVTTVLPTDSQVSHRAKTSFVHTSQGGAKGFTDLALRVQEAFRETPPMEHHYKALQIQAGLEVLQLRRAGAHRAPPTSSEFLAYSTAVSCSYSPAGEKAYYQPSLDNLDSTVSSPLRGRGKEPRGPSVTLHFPDQKN